MRTRIRSETARPIDSVSPRSDGLAHSEYLQTSEGYAAGNTTMAQVNGLYRETTPIDTSIVPPGRVISTSMMRQG